MNFISIQLFFKKIRLSKETGNAFSVLLAMPMGLKGTVLACGVTVRLVLTVLGVPRAGLGR